MKSPTHNGQYEPINIKRMQRGIAMPRVARELSESGLYHITARGVGSQIIFYSDGHYVKFLDMLAQSCATHRVAIIAWCLMANHVHFLLENEDDERPDGFSKAMHSLLCRYAMYFNRSTERVGHVFQNRFGCSAINSDRYALQAATYIQRNALDAGFEVDEYPWSSFQEYAGVCRDDIGWLCKTDVLIGLAGSREGLIEYFMNGPCDDYRASCRTSRLNDGEALDRALSVLPEDVALHEVKALGVKRRNGILVSMREAGLLVKQIGRFTGIGISTISRATSRVMP